MKKILYIFITIIIIALIFVASKLFIENNCKLEVKQTMRESCSLQVTQKEIEDKDNYYSEIEKLNSQTFMDEQVNTYIASIRSDFIEETKSYNKLKKGERAVITDTIDSYEVNDNLYGIRITINMKKVNSDEYTTIIKTYNFDSTNQKEINLNDLFKSGYEEIVGKYDQVLLKEKAMYLYDGEYLNEVKYNDLKEYVIKDMLLSQNLDITQEEYDELFASKVDPNKKMVAITFDDGPNPNNTPQILEALKQNNAKATFFMLGQNVKQYPETVKSVYDLGNEIGIHTWDHPQLTKLSVENIKKQVSDTSDAIFEITGYRPTIVRPPYGSFNDTVKSTLSDYSLILWNIDSLDWKSRDENKFVPLVMNDVQDGDIILLHDIHSTTVPGAQKIITQLTEQGYQLVTVSELIEAKGYDTSKAQVFYSGRQ